MAKMKEWLGLYLWISSTSNPKIDAKLKKKVRNGSESRSLSLSEANISITFDAVNGKEPKKS